MINPITDLTVTATNLDNITYLNFKFTRPDPLIELGGYRLYISSTGSDYILYDTKIDSSHQRAASISTYMDEDSYTHFTSTITEDLWKGRLVYFKMVSIDTKGIPTS